MGRIILSAKDINGLKSIINGWAADNMIQKKTQRTIICWLKTTSGNIDTPQYILKLFFLKERNLKVVQRKECIYV